MRVSLLFFVVSCFCLETGHAISVGDLEYRNNGITINMEFGDKNTTLGVMNDSDKDVLIKPTDIKITTTLGTFTACIFHDPSLMIGGSILNIPDNLVITKGDKRMVVISGCASLGSPVIVGGLIKEINIGEFKVYPSSFTQTVNGKFVKEPERPRKTKEEAESEMIKAIDMVISIFFDTNKEQGITGLMLETEKCYKENIKTSFYCICFDLASRRLSNSS